MSTRTRFEKEAKGNSEIDRPLGLRVYIPNKNLFYAG